MQKTIIYLALIYSSNLLSMNPDNRGQDQKHSLDRARVSVGFDNKANANSQSDARVTIGNVNNNSDASVAITVREEDQKRQKANLTIASYKIASIEKLIQEYCTEDFPCNYNSFGKYFFDVKDVTVLNRLLNSNRSVVSPCGKLIAQARYDGVIMICDSANNKCIKELQDADLAKDGLGGIFFFQLQFSNCGNYLISVNKKINRTKIWYLRNFTCLATFDDTRSYDYSNLIYQPDGNFISPTKRYSSSGPSTKAVAQEDVGPSNSNLERLFESRAEAIINGSAERRERISTNISESVCSIQ